MTLPAGMQLYQGLNLRGWSNDVEVLYRAKSFDIPVQEHEIRWEDKAGSKLVKSAGGAVGASASMLFEVIWLRFMYVLGLWRI